MEEWMEETEERYGGGVEEEEEEETATAVGSWVAKLSLYIYI